MHPGIALHVPCFAPPFDSDHNRSCDSLLLSHDQPLDHSVASLSLSVLVAARVKSKLAKRNDSSLKQRVTRQTAPSQAGTKLELYTIASYKDRQLLSSWPLRVQHLSMVLPPQATNPS
jgi:hypothetical protein